MFVFCWNELSLFTKFEIATLACAQASLQIRNIEPGSKVVFNHSSNILHAFVYLGTSKTNAKGKLVGLAK